MKHLSRITVVLGLLVMLTGTLRAEVVLHMAGWGGAPDIEGFEQLHPDVKIEYTRVPGSYGFIEQTTVWAAAGSLPDIILIPYWGLPSMADSRVLMDLTAVAAKDAGWLNGFFPGSLDAFRRNGKLFGVPWLVGPMTVVYNPELFARSGVATPLAKASAGTWTLDEMANDTRKLTSKTNDGRFKTVGMFSRTDQIPYIAPFVWAAGGNIVADDGTTVLLGEPNSISALSRVASLYSTERVFVSNAQTKEYGIDYNETMRGANTAMRLVWNVEYGPISAAGIPVDIAPSPIDPSGNGTNLVISHGIGISSQTKHADLAWEYVKYALSLVPTNLEFPARQEHFAPWAEEMKTRVGWDAYKFLNLTMDSVRLGPRPIDADVERLFNRYLGRALIGTITAEVAAEEITRLVKEELSK